MTSVNNSLPNLLYELSNLQMIQRSGISQFLFEDFESLAEHHYKVIFIAYFLAQKLMAKGKNLDMKKVLVMAIFHDANETRTGDSNWIQKPYLTQDEEKATREQFGDIDKPLSGELLEILEEYEERKSLESHVVKDADYIEYFICLRQLEVKGNKEATERIRYETKQLGFLYTNEGKALLREVLAVDPNEWTRKNHLGTHKSYTQKAQKVTEK